MVIIPSVAVPMIEQMVTFLKKILSLHFLIFIHDRISTCHHSETGVYTQIWVINSTDTWYLPSNYVMIFQFLFFLLIIISSVNLVLPANILQSNEVQVYLYFDWLNKHLII